MKNTSPFKFLSSYTKNERDIYFGRDKEIEQLYRLVNRTKVLLLYGLSGTGKTSLIQAGLVNKFEEGQRRFLFVRKGENILNSLRNEVRLQSDSLVPPHTAPASILKTLYYDYLEPITLIFDQFEELFISGDLDEIEEFKTAIEEIIASDLKIKIIFSLREEYLAHMDNLEDKIPTIFNHRLRLEKMRPNTVLKVIKGIIEAGGYTIENEEVPKTIMNNISDRKGVVELPYLQVYLSQLKDEINDNVFSMAEVNKIGELEDVLGDFLDKQLKIIASSKTGQNDVFSVLRKMVTYDGTKAQLPLTEFSSVVLRADLTLEVILERLQQSRIVSLDDGIYELSHDSLAKKIYEKRTAIQVKEDDALKTIIEGHKTWQNNKKRLLSSEELNEIKPYLNHPDITEKQKLFVKKSKLRILYRRIFTAAAVLMVLLVILGIVSTNNSKNYNNYIKRGFESFEKYDYDQALAEFRNAGNVSEILRNPWKDTLSTQVVNNWVDTCERYTNSLRHQYRSLIDKGDDYFQGGIKKYDLAFNYYNKALSLSYKDELTEAKVKRYRHQAINRYSELARLEADDGHFDIAVFHLTKSYFLNPEDRLNPKIKEYLVKTNKDDLYINLTNELIQQKSSMEGYQEKVNRLKSTLTYE